MSLLANTLAVQDIYASESEKIRMAFARSHDGEAAICQRSALVDSVIRQLWNSEPGAESAHLCVAAIGGYGRGTLFPGSDVDLLFILTGPLSRRSDHDSPRIARPYASTGCRTQPRGCRS